MKKLMILGGSAYILPVIEEAHKMGLYVLTCDYLPDNIAHKYSDEYCNESVIDKEAVLRLCEKKQIDGIISFACDPGVVTAAYVAEKMGLPFQGSYDSVRILQDKGLFRQFLRENGFNTPKAKRYTDKEEPFRDEEFFNWPVIVKPVDSAGSKGVQRVDNPEDLREAIENAVSISHCDSFIIEEFITFLGYHSSADYFTIDGKLVFSTYSDQLFDPEADNPYTPAWIIWPTTMEREHQEELTSEIQRLMALLKMCTGIYNIETCVGNDGTPYIMEVSPRGGGCRIGEIQEMAYGVNLIRPEIQKAAGLPLDEISSKLIDGVWCEMIVHASHGKSGIYHGLTMRDDIQTNNLRSVQLTVDTGDEVKPFTGANTAIGDVFLRFDNRESLDKAIRTRLEWLKIAIKENQ